MSGPLLAHIQLGNCWQDKGQLDEAMAEYRRAIEVDPKGGAAHFKLGLCWQARGRLDQYRDGIPARAEEESGLHYHNWLEANVLRREAEALILSTGSRSGPENRERGVAQK